MRILIVGGISKSLVNFRGPLIRAMRERGHDVLACAGEPEREVAEALRAWGVEFAPVRLSRAGSSAWEDARTFLELRCIVRDFKPDLVIGYTIKPVVWGGLAARSCGTSRIFSLVTGLGYAFMNGDSLKGRLTGWIAKRLYRASLRHSRRVFFQNPDDKRAFVEMGLVEEAKCVVISGSGVDVDFFSEPGPSSQAQGERGARSEGYVSPVSSSVGALEPMGHSKAAPAFLLIARLLWDKGIGEYVEAARRIGQDAEPRPRFALAGAVDPNPSSVKQADLDGWIEEGVIDYLGYLEDVRPAYRECSVYVLPSYREGTPRTVLEAMSMGRPIITTDAPGCRETVRPASAGESSSGDGWRRVGKLKIGANGILVPPRDAEALADAMRFFLDHPRQLADMGRESRRYAEERYDVHKVNEVLLKEMGL